MARFRPKARKWIARLGEFPALLGSGLDPPSSHVSFLDISEKNDMAMLPDPIFCTVHGLQIRAGIVELVNG